MTVRRSLWAPDRPSIIRMKACANPVVWMVHLEWFRFGRSWDRCIAPVLADLTTEANYCDQHVPLKAGGTDPPTIRSRELLMLMLAWRIQAEREGGLEPQARRAMRRATGAPAEAATLTLPVRCQTRGGEVRQLNGEGRALILRQRRDPVLIKGLRRAHQLAAAMAWSAADGSFRQTDVTSPTSAYERKLVRLVFLAPDLQRDILEGRQAPGLTLQRLLHAPLPLAWDRQRQVFGAGR